MAGHLWVHLDLAKAVGLDEAAMLCRLYGDLKIWGAPDTDGWYRRSRLTLVEWNPWLTDNSIRRVLKSLEHQGLLEIRSSGRGYEGCRYRPDQEAFALRLQQEVGITYGEYRQGKGYWACIHGGLARSEGIKLGLLLSRFAVLARQQRQGNTGAALHESYDELAALFPCWSRWQARALIRQAQARCLMESEYIPGEWGKKYWLSERSIDAMKHLLRQRVDQEFEDFLQEASSPNRLELVA